MWSDFWDDAVDAFKAFMGLMVFLLIIAAFLAAIIGSANIIAHKSCDASTRDIGYPSRYGFYEGCQIEVKPGQWIPLESYYYKEDK